MLVLGLNTAYIHVTFIMIFSLNICTSNTCSQAGTKTGCRVILFFLFFFSLLIVSSLSSEHLLQIIIRWGEGGGSKLL